MELDEYNLPPGDELPPQLGRDDCERYNPTPETIALRAAAIRREWTETIRAERAGTNRPVGWEVPAVSSGDVALERQLAGLFDAEHS